METTSYIVKNLVPNIPFTFQVLIPPIFIHSHHISIPLTIPTTINQVIAAEDFGSVFGISYYRGPETSFVTKTRQKQVSSFLLSF